MLSQSVRLSGCLKLSVSTASSTKRGTLCLTDLDGCSSPTQDPWLEEQRCEDDAVRSSTFRSFAGFFFDGHECHGNEPFRARDRPYGIWAHTLQVAQETKLENLASMWRAWSVDARKRKTTVFIAFGNNLVQFPLPKISPVSVGPCEYLSVTCLLLTGIYGTKHLSMTCLLLYGSLASLARRLLSLQGLPLRGIMCVGAGEET